MAFLVTNTKSINLDLIESIKVEPSNFCQLQDKKTCFVVSFYGVRNTYEIHPLDRHSPDEETAAEILALAWYDIFIKMLCTDINLISASQVDKKLIEMIDGESIEDFVNMYQDIHCERGNNAKF